MRSGEKSRRGVRLWEARLCKKETYWMGRKHRFAVSYVIKRRDVNASSQKRKGIFAAWVCLFAAVALYAPLAGAAWSVHAMSCCTGEYCPIAAHHHHQKKQAASHSEMDCGHDLGAMMNCSMSCCENSEKPLVTAVAFVLPNAVLTSAAMAVSGADEALQVLEIPRSLTPLSPPPRFANAS